MNWKKKTKKGQTDSTEDIWNMQIKRQSEFSHSHQFNQICASLLPVKSIYFFSPTQRWWLYCMLYVAQGPHTMLTELGCFFLCSQPHCGSRTILATQQKYFTTSKCPTLQQKKNNLSTDDGKLIGSIYNKHWKSAHFYLFIF